jgi:Arc/MetJ-type ribon-helix-helix transcriptional regulator
MARPKGPEKVDLTITLTKPVSEWLDAQIAKGDIRTKSQFIEDLIKGEMAEEEHTRNMLAHMSPEDRETVLEALELKKPKKR